MVVERRQFLRVVCRGALAELFVDGVSVGVHRIEDVSDRGLFVGAPSPVLPLHTRVEVHITDSRPPAVGIAEVVQVVRPGSHRAPGYGLRVESGLEDVVEVVASAAHSASPADVGGEDPPQEPARALVALRNPKLAKALAEGLVAFGVPALHVPLEKVRANVKKGLRVGLLEMSDASDGLALLKMLRTEAPKARVLLAASALPDARARRELQEAGVDQLLLHPFDPFEVMKKLFARAGGDLGR